MLQDLKDRDVFGRMDPYAVVTCGGQRVRTKTHTDGGRNPVWGQSFQFNVINENTVEVELYDSDTLSRDDRIGSCTVDLSRARMNGSDSQQAAVRTSKGKQHGFISVRINFTPNQPQQQAQPQQQQQAAHAPPAQWGPYGAPVPHPGPMVAASMYPPQPAGAYYGAPAGYPGVAPHAPSAPFYPGHPQPQYYAAPPRY